MITRDKKNVYKDETKDRLYNFTRIYRLIHDNEGIKDRANVTQCSFASL